jgi:sodium transport system permease protein
VSTTALAVGKWAAAWLSAVAVTAITLGGFVLAAVLYAERKLPALLHFGPSELARFLAVAVPLAAMTSAAQMFISTYGRTYREAQTYVSYLTTVVAFVPAIVMFSGAREAAWQSAVPVLGQLMSLQRVLRGDGLVVQETVIAALVAFALAIAAVAAVARLLRDERIVFGRS